MESEFRQNLATKEWVVIAPARSKKPRKIKVESPATQLIANPYEPNCPFCPGNENVFPVVELQRLSRGDGNWSVRVIENEYKILGSYDSCPIILEPFETEGIYHKLKGCGSHELVIDSYLHNKTILNMTCSEIQDMLWMLHQRYLALQKNPSNLVSIVFKNYGAFSGQTQVHSHTQIVASRVVPSYLRLLLHEAERHFDSFGSCVYCDMLNFELKHGERIVCENNEFIVFVPFAASVEHETWVLPKRHSASWENLPEPMFQALAEILRFIFCKFETAIGKPDFNFFIRISPYPLSRVPYFHWHMQLLPRTKIIGGFEFGTKIPVNTIMPEESAKILRECPTCK